MSACSYSKWAYGSSRFFFYYFPTFPWTKFTAQTCTHARFRSWAAEPEEGKRFWLSKFFAGDELLTRKARFWFGAEQVYTHSWNQLASFMGKITHYEYPKIREDVKSIWNKYLKWVSENREKSLEFIAKMKYGLLRTWIVEKSERTW